MVPALGVAEALQFMALKSSEGSIREKLSESTEKLHEAVTAMREVQSFSLQRIVIDGIERRIIETITPASKRAAVIKGIMMGMIQLIQFLGKVPFQFRKWFVTFSPPRLTLCPYSLCDSLRICFLVWRSND